MGFLQLLVEDAAWSEDEVPSVEELVDTVLWFGVVVRLPTGCVGGPVVMRVKELELCEVGNVLGERAGDHGILLLLEQRLQDEGQCIDGPASVVCQYVAWERRHASFLVSSELVQNTSGRQVVEISACCPRQPRLPDVLSIA